MSKKLYIGTQFPPAIKDKESQYDYNKRLEEYQAHPFIMFFSENNIQAIHEAKKMDLKDLSCMNHIWSK